MKSHPKPYLRCWKNHQSPSLRHRRKFRVEKGEEQKIALLLIDDQEKVNNGKKQNRQRYVFVGKEACYYGKDGQD